ncbi:MAG: DevR family CRISPR-associated autoregulator [Acidilobus sp.]
MAFLSLTVRYLINTEALNGVENVGNISRHRVAPIVIPMDNSYTLKYMPVVSGESLAHGYQSVLVDVAKSESLPLGKRSSVKEFVKFADYKLLKEEEINPPKDATQIREVETAIMLKDVVADVGGFLYTGKAKSQRKRTSAKSSSEEVGAEESSSEDEKNQSLKRTSAFQVSYMIPAYGVSPEVAAVESQFHVRYSVDQQEYQKPYNVDVGSALYTFTFDLDMDVIATPVNQGNKAKGEDELAGEKKKRQRAALLALARFLENLEFGAKKSRFHPVVDFRDAVMTLTEKPFVVTPAVTNDYADKTANRLKVLSDMKVVAVKKFMTVNVAPKSGYQAEQKDTIAEAINEVIKSLDLH